MRWPLDSLRSLGAGLWLLLLVQDAPAVRVTGVEVKERVWTVKGTVQRPDGTEVVVALRRIERRWDGKAARFVEFLSDETRVRGAAALSKGAFSAPTKAAPEGLYQVTIAEGETLLHECRTVVARLDDFFRVAKVRLKAVMEIAERSKGYLDEIAAILKGDVRPTAKLCDDFVKRVSRDEAALESLARDSDFSATVALLRDALAHARNAQVWSLQKKSAPEEEDAVAGKKGHFLDHDLTLGALQESVASVPGVLSREIRVSIAVVLADALTTDRAKQAATLAGAVPEPSKEFIAVLEGDDLEAMRKAFKGVSDSLLKK